MRTTRARLKAGQSEASRNEMEKILQTQKMLRTRRLEENRERFKDGTLIDDDPNKHVQKLTSINCYREATDFSPNLRAGYCGVDESTNVVFIPFNMIHVPFHISTVRVCQYQQHDTGKTRYHTIRFAFHTPGSSGESEILPQLSGNRSVFLKEVAIKSDKGTHCQDLVKKVQDMQKKLKNKESQGPTAQISQLVPNRSPNKVLLRHLMVRYTGCPSRRSIGNLEAHMNGVRYTSAGGREMITINYSNVKHCIFQPCKSDLHTILHFNLKSPIIVNNKRQHDIQFYTEICAMVDDLQSRRRRMRDPDELAEEAKELHIQNKHNGDYKRFVEGMEQFSKDEMIVEVPIRKLAFRGVPKNENVLLMPTSRALLHLSTWPSFIVSLDEIEIVCLERVSHGLKNFDLTIVFKDHSICVAQSINACDVSAIDQIKRWLTECDIVWYESTLPLNWRQILKTIRQDPSGFYNELGGFGAFMADGDDGKTREDGGGDSDSDEEDELFKDDASESSDSDSGSSSSQSSQKEGGSSDSEGSGGAKDGDEEDGGAEESGDWDNMEKRAAEDDRKRREREQPGSDDENSGDEGSPSKIHKLAKKRRML
eukprot:GHVH01010630.1.p1 GENE.GHVH01010630.1~~GHVH01010630.1.p1  ORF type:complete len:595 (+),score=95.14 GHVH01010630.1:51-1835(+)